MTLRRRLTLWYGGLLVVSVMLALWPTFKEIVLEASERSETPAGAWEEFGEIVGEMATTSLPLLLIGLSIGWWMTKRALHPLEHVIAAAERLTEQTLGQRLPQQKQDLEIARLTEVLNAMLARLDSSFTQVREFTLHASHELKTPLAILHCSIENALRDWKNLEGSQRTQLGSQMEEIERLARTVDQLGTLTRADAGQLALAFQPVDMRELVAEMTDNAEYLARAKSIKVALRESEEVRVIGDRDRLRQVLLNLTDNAIKYNDEGGSVSIFLQREAEQALLTISNTGPGLAPELIFRVFDRFFRGPESGGAVEGCGLGLSIAHWIVSAHHGTITFDSSSKGLTTVIVRLPLAGRIWADSGPQCVS